MLDYGLSNPTFETPNHACPQMVLLKAWGYNSPWCGLSIILGYEHYKNSWFFKWSNLIATSILTKNLVHLTKG
jgi:hypothetical protein